jgi:hypothetical protein
MRTVDAATTAVRELLLDDLEQMLAIPPGFSAATSAKQSRLPPQLIG